MLRTPFLPALMLSVTFASAVEWEFPCPQSEIAHYTAYHIQDPMRIDGRLDEPSWKRVPWLPRFTDILTGQPVIHDTRAAVLWDEDNLYVAYRVEESFVRAKFTTNNSPTYYDNDVEFFVTSPDAYYEFEINGLHPVHE
jgi:hypothetical protein